MRRASRRPSWLLRRRARPLAREVKPAHCACARGPRGERSAKGPAASALGEAIAPSYGALPWQAARGERSAKRVRGRLEYVAEEDLAVRRSHVAVVRAARRPAGNRLAAPARGREVNPGGVSRTLAVVAAAVASAHRGVGLGARGGPNAALAGPLALAAEAGRVLADFVRRASGVTATGDVGDVCARRRVALAALRRFPTRGAPARDEGQHAQGPAAMPRNPRGHARSSPSGALPNEPERGEDGAGEPRERGAGVQSSKGARAA